MVVGCLFVILVAGQISAQESAIDGADASVPLAELEAKAISKKEIAENYLDWFYGKSISCENIDDADLEDLSFKDAIFVSDIRFVADNEYVDIELYDDVNK